MRKIPILFVYWLACVSVAGALAPRPESDQPREAQKIIDAFHGRRPETPPKKLHIVYYTPSDRPPADRHEERLEAILEDIRGFYGREMERLGFGKKTFALDRDAAGKLVIHLVKGSEPEATFLGWEGRNGGNTGAPASGDKVRRECEPILQRKGISLDNETVMIFCHLAKYDEAARTFRHRSPYFGSWTQQSGLCFAADWTHQDLGNLTRKEPILDDAEYGKMPLGKHMTIFVGGIAHELGHAFALPHCGERWDEKERGTSLLGGGNHTYREELRGEGKGSFLTMATAMRLASRPLFNGSDKGEKTPGQLGQCELVLSTNLTRSELAGRKGKLRVEGTVAGSPPIYGIVAYFDSARDGGYRAPTATATPDSEGRFALEISDLKASENGELRIEFCHANGAVSERRHGFKVARDGRVDLSEWELRRALEPFANAVIRENRAEAQRALQQMADSGASELARNVARKVAETLQPGSKPTPAEAGASMMTLALGDAQATSAEVGWLQPAANRIPLNGEIQSPFLDAGKLYATGLFAHSPARYVFDLGGRWRRLRGEGGLHTFHQRHGSVVFVIKADDREIYRSAAIRGGAKAKYDVDVEGVKTVEMIVEKAGSSNGGNWGLWLDPTLARGEREKR